MTTIWRVGAVAFPRLSATYSSTHSSPFLQNGSGFIAVRFSRGFAESFVLPGNTYLLARVSKLPPFSFLLGMLDLVLSAVSSTSTTLERKSRSASPSLSIALRTSP